MQWTFHETLYDLDFADDLALLAQRYQDIRIKSGTLNTYGQLIGLNINASKTKLLKVNHKTDNAETINDKRIEEIKDFLYFGS